MQFDFKCTKIRQRHALRQLLSQVGIDMKHLLFALFLCIVFTSTSFAASIEQERLLGSVSQGEEEQQEQKGQKITKSDSAEKIDSKTENQEEDTHYLIIPKTLSNYLLKTGQIKDGKVLVKPVE